MPNTQCTSAFFSLYNLQFYMLCILHIAYIVHTWFAIRVKYSQTYCELYILARIFIYTLRLQVIPTTSLRIGILYICKRRYSHILLCVYLHIYMCRYRNLCIFIPHADRTDHSIFQCDQFVLRYFVAASNSKILRLNANDWMKWL